MVYSTTHKYIPTAIGFRTNTVLKPMLLHINITFITVYIYHRHWPLIRCINKM